MYKARKEVNAGQRDRGKRGGGDKKKGSGETLVLTLVITRLTGSCPTTQHHGRISDHMPLAWEKIQMQTSRYGFY